MWRRQSGLDERGGGGRDESLVNEVQDCILLFLDLKFDLETQVLECRLCDWRVFCHSTEIPDHNH